MPVSSVFEMISEFDERVAELEPFDTSAWLGRPASGWVAYRTAEELDAALKKSGFHGALISHKIGEMNDALLGNRALAADLPKLPNCHGVLSLVPPGTGEFDDLEEVLATTQKVGFRAVRIFPKAHRWSLRVPTVPQLLRALEKHGFPLFISIGQTSWAEIAGIAKDYPKLAVVVDGVGHHEYLNIRGCLPWLEAAPNIIADTHSLFLVGSLEWLVDRIGISRIVYGSNQPVDDPAAGLYLLAYSELKLDLKRRIAHGNAKQLIEGVGKGGYFA